MCSRHGWNEPLRINDSARPVEKYGANLGISFHLYNNGMLSELNRTASMRRFL